jgi:hypothetical protein
MRRAWKGGWVAGLCLVLPALASAQQVAPSADAAATVNAAWVEHDLQFTFMGITAYYSCDGMRDKVRWILEQLGARPGFKLTTRGCPRANGPETAPGLRIVAALPAAASPGTAGEFPARPRRVQFRSSFTSNDLQDGDCELMEQLRDKVFVPMGAKLVEDNTRCVPHQEVIGAVDMTLEVLEPVRTP